MVRLPTDFSKLPVQSKEDVTMESPEERVEQNKAKVRRMLERLSAGDIDGFMEGIGPDYVRHCQAMPPELQEIRGQDTLRQWLVSNKETFPDYDEEIQMLVGEGDFVAWRSVGRGTQMGALGPFPATEKTMELVIIGMHRFDNGLIAETWTSWDNLAAFTQLGLLQGA
jgi:predicted ester cyclase